MYTIVSTITPTIKKIKYDKIKIPITVEIRKIKYVNILIPVLYSTHFVLFGFDD